jgi:hypothetical protein
VRDGALRDEGGRAARAHAEARFGGEAAVDHYEAYFRRVIASRAKAG